MPGLIDLENTKSGSVIAVSVDENYSDFSRFIKRHKNAPFKFILNNGSERALQVALKPYIKSPWTGYPTIMLINEDNIPMGQGNYSIDEMATFLFQ